MEETMLERAGSIGKPRRVGEEVTQLWTTPSVQVVEGATHGAGIAVP